jgi:hypothetical protein
MLNFFDGVSESQNEIVRKLMIKKNKFEGTDCIPVQKMIYLSELRIQYQQNSVSPDYKNLENLEFIHFK